MRLALLEALSAAADEITRDLAPGSVYVRLRGREPSFVVTPPLTASFAEPETDPVGNLLLAAQDDDGAMARINFRLAETLKAGSRRLPTAQACRSTAGWSGPLRLPGQRRPERQRAAPATRAGSASPAGCGSPAALTPHLSYSSRHRDLATHLEDNHAHVQHP